MNCFVIMPFSRDFDDVYSTIKASVESALVSSCGPSSRCFRLDEPRPAGRITDRLLREISAANLCVADVTGTVANVMWEVGYAMALGKPVIVVTQARDTVPFDIRDLQSLQYDRNHLSHTLGEPLKTVIIDTIQTLPGRAPPRSDPGQLIGLLLAQIDELKKMLEGSAQALNTLGVERITESELRPLEGAWVNLESGTHLYAQVVGNDLIGAYCYGGDDELTGMYYGWRRAGEYWFARFMWFDQPVDGFAFLKRTSIDVLQGAWWQNEEGMPEPTAPPTRSGVPAEFRREPGRPPPKWAARFFKETNTTRLAKILEKRKGSK